MATRRNGFLAGLTVAMMALVGLHGCGWGEDKKSSAEEVVEAAAERLDRARGERTLNRLEQLRLAMSRYAIDHDGSFPEGSSLAGISGELAPRYMPLLEAEDAWGNTMTYASDGRGYSIVSIGPDGVSGTDDDIALRDGAVTGGS